MNHRIPTALASSFATAVLAAGCGGDDGQDGARTGTATNANAAQLQPVKDYLLEHTDELQKQVGARAAVRDFVRTAQRTYQAANPARSRSTSRTGPANAEELRVRRPRRRVRREQAAEGA